MASLNLALRFACELAALVAVAWLGWQTSPVLAVVFPLVVAVVWGLGIAPRAPSPLRRMAGSVSIVELLIFA